MMRTLILYGSKYGSAARYAEELSKQTDIPAVIYQKTPPLSDFDVIVYIGAMYAGGMLGLSDTFRRYSPSEEQKVLLVTVGLADPEIPENRENIRKSLKKQIAADLYEHAKFFHLRGSIDYQKLSFAHRGMMALLHNSLKKKEREEWSEEDKALMETYGKKVDFVDLSQLQPIIDEMGGKNV